MPVKRQSKEKLLRDPLTLKIWGVAEAEFPVVGRMANQATALGIQVFKP
jgi:hypothetical protein